MAKPFILPKDIPLDQYPKPGVFLSEGKRIVDAARQAVARVADARGAGVEETARATGDMVDEAMLGALRVVTVQRGRTPSDFALVAFGGAGGVHANALAKILGSYPVIVPEESLTTSVQRITYAQRRRTSLPGARRK